MYEENKKDDSKKILLAVLAVAILIILVVGISFAIFTYTREGERENVVTTGTIQMNYTEGTNGINITEAIPMSEEQALAQYNGGTGSVGTDVNDNTSISDNVFDFTVSADIRGNTSIDYDIVAVKANEIDSDCTPAAYAAALRIGTEEEKANDSILYAACSLVSDEDIRLWIGEAGHDYTNASNKFIEDSNYNAPTLTDSDYTAIDLNGDSEGDSSAWHEGTAHTSKLDSPADSMLLKFDKFSSTGTRYYRLKMWVDQAYIVDAVPRTYKVKINVYAKDRGTADMSN